MTRIAALFFVYLMLTFESFAQCTIAENGHAFKVKITIDNTKVEGSGSHTNIPVLISHTDANMKTLANGGYVKNANGYDIVFTDASGTQIDHQLVSYNASTGAIEAWVEVPSLSTSADTDIYIYFGNDDIVSDPSTNGTFSSNYEGVYLLDEDPSSSVTGYTSNANSLTSSGSMTSGDEVTAKVGNGLDFDGTDDYVTRAYDSDFDFGTGSFSVSGWIKTAGSTGGTPTDIIPVRISSGADDVEESGSDGNMYTTSTDLEIVDDGSSSRANQTIGLRFNNIAIPQGSTINSASIVFTGDGSSSGTCNLTIKGNDSDNASAIGTSDYYLTTGITLTSASASWSPASSWSDGVTYTSSDISGIVQEIVDRGGWSSGNSMLFTISGSGISDELRRAFSYEGSASDAPLLQINYGGASDMTIVSRYDDDQGFKLYMDGSGKIHFGIDDDGSWDPDFKVSSTAAYDDDTWHYVTGVKYDDDSIALFIDGNHIDGTSIVTAATPVQTSIAQSSDDAEEREPSDGGSVDLTSGDLEMEDDVDDPHYNQTIGLRFQNITIPNGATVDSAFIKFMADGTETGSASLTVTGHDTDNAPTFANSGDKITGRAQTSATVSWSNVEAWTNGQFHYSPDLKSIVQEIVDRGGWSSGNAIAFIIEGSGSTDETRRTHSYDKGGGELPAELFIYTGSSPMATLSSNSAPLTIGSDEPTNGKYFDGIIDEVRLASTAWDAGYIATEYNNVNSPSTFYSTTASAPDTSYYWTGATSTDWNTASNWTPAIVPSAESTVVIKDVTNDPVLGSDAEINTLYIKSGAVFNSGAYNLAVYEELINDGTFNAGTGTVTFNLAGDQDICQNAFNNLVLKGSGTKSLTSAIDVDGNLTIEGTAQLDVTASNYTINVAGNWNVTSTNGDPFLEGNGTVIFDGGNAQTISHSGTGELETFNNLTIDKAANDITLLFPVTINGTLRFLTGGKIILGTHDLTIGSSGSIIGYDASKYVVAGSTGTLRQQNIGSGGRTGGIVFPVGYSTASYTPVTIDNTSGTADRFDVNICDKIYDDGNCSGGTEYTTMVVDKTWHISEGASGGSNAAITLQWNGTDEQSFDNSNCVISHFTGGAWVPEMTATSASGSDPYTLTATGISSFSPFGVGDNPGLLPVQLLYFRGQHLMDSVQLTWATATETNNDYFTLERSSNGLDFTPIARIKGAGNTKSRKEYAYADKNLSGNLRYYRLKQTDFDGKYEYFNIIAVDISSQQQAVRIYPNPAESELHLDGQFNEETQMSFTLTDVMGNILIEDASSQYGHFERLIDVSRYPPGLYCIKININGSISVNKIVIGTD